MNAYANDPDDDEQVGDVPANEDCGNESDEGSEDSSSPIYNSQEGEEED